MGKADNLTSWVKNILILGFSGLKLCVGFLIVGIVFVVINFEITF